MSRRNMLPELVIDPEFESYVPPLTQEEFDLLEERTFFPDALRMLGRKLSLMTRISMKTAEKKKLVKILHLKLMDPKE